MAVLAITPRFLTELAPMIGQRQFGDEVWADTHVVVPIHEDKRKYCNVFTGENVTAKNLYGQTGLRLAEVFRYFPVALLATTQ